MSEHCSNRAFSILLVFLVSIASPASRSPRNLLLIMGLSSTVFADIDDFEPQDTLTHVA